MAQTMTTTTPTNHTLLMVLAALLIACTTNNDNPRHGSVRAFAPVQQRFGRSSINISNIGIDLAKLPSFLAMSSSSSSDENGKDDEIAQLEEQLRKLREEKTGDASPEAASAPNEEETAAATTTKVADGDDDDELEEATMDMFLSEGWKEARSNYSPGNTATKKRQDEEQGNLVGTVAKIAGGILALVLFSQIPVGQEDLSKYSAIKSGPATTTIDLGDTNSVKGQRSGDL